MVDIEIVSSGSITMDSRNVVSRMNKTSSSEKANKVQHPITENVATMEVWCTHAMSVVGASKRSVHRMGTRVYRREEYKHMRMMEEQ